jgi:hypothetical protein
MLASDRSRQNAARAADTFETQQLDPTFSIAGTHLHVHIDGWVDANMLYQGSNRLVPEGSTGVEYRYVGTGDGANSRR